MALHLAEQAPEAGLAPAATTRSGRFLRWLAFLVGAVYPTFTYGDDPSRYVRGEAAQAELRAGTDAYGQRCWRIGRRARAGPLVPGRALLGSRPLRLRREPLAAAAPLVRRALPEAARRGGAGRRRPALGRGLGAQLRVGWPPPAAGLLPCATDSGEVRWMPSFRRDREAPAHGPPAGRLPGPRPGADGRAGAGAGARLADVPGNCNVCGAYLPGGACC